jgi:phospholipid N-methyltransferase
MNPQVYRRPNKPAVLAVKVRGGMSPPLTELPITVPEVHKDTECHVTPEVYGDVMVSVLGDVSGKRICEPEAGTGMLVHCLLKAGVMPVNIVAVELNNSLFQTLEKRFHGQPVTLKNECFLEFAESCEMFDSIVMNPPFRQVNRHIDAAIKVLRSGGMLVALVPITFNRSGFDLVETLPDDVFAATTVNTKIVRYVKP